MTDKMQCFVAYPSSPESLAETIEEAIRKIDAGGVVRINSWKSTVVGGKFIILEICKEILNSNVFICDLTDLNHNVLFELGYAIAKDKRIWILLDPSREHASSNYKMFEMLTTIGYIPYNNSRDIVDAFYDQAPYSDVENTIYKDSIVSSITGEKEDTILYLKSAIDTDASIKVSRLVHNCAISYIVDDPGEVGIQTLSWYANEVEKAIGVIAHFLSQKHTGWRMQNAKNSLVSGLAYGFKKDLLMLAHAPYESPVDYKDLLFVHRKSTDCEKKTNMWINNIELILSQEKKLVKKVFDKIKAETELHKLSLGDPVAENEQEDILRYFVKTAPYIEAKGSRHSILIGRKGSGKTAILFKVADEFEKDLRNHVLIIKPIAYVLEGVLKMLKQELERSDRGYLIESFWKFMIYSEITRSIYNEIKNKPAYYTFTDAENELISFCNDNENIIEDDFSIRLENIVNKLHNLSEIDLSSKQRIKISELLHITVIAKLKILLENVLSEKQDVMILIDNLDKTWERREDLSIFKDFLFGLISVSKRIAREFNSKLQNNSTNIFILIFLRSDIFRQIHKYAREGDKIAYKLITWEDPQMLTRVIEERIMDSVKTPIMNQDVWNKYFCKKVDDIEIKEYIIKNILPRPRDIISLIKIALSQAINRGHTLIDSEDMLYAKRQYSQKILESLVVENSVELDRLEELLYEFIGSNEVITDSDIKQAVSACSIKLKKIKNITILLCDVTFLGREIGKDRFIYSFNEEDKSKIIKMSNKYIRESNIQEPRYKIHKAFHEYLEIKDN